MKLVAFIGVLVSAIFVASHGCSGSSSSSNAGPCAPPPREPAMNIRLAQAAPFGDRTFEDPTEIVPGPANRFYVVEQPGRVRVVPSNGGEPTTAIDLTSKVHSGGEAGLLGIAFDPAFADNGFVYLHFDQAITTRPGVVFQSVIARFVSRDGGATFDPASEKRLLVIDQPFANHNGGKIAFGPDGFLYIGFGDGGSGGDPRGNGQNRDVLLGKILRIDPNGGDPYAIPPTNPFANGGGRPEIYAFGLRNPWKFAFDSLTGDLWASDVGQNAFEEVDRIVLGGNYGWNTREGMHCLGAPTCSTEGLIEPVIDYPRTDGVSITGGYVYRGTKIPALVGRYVYGDFGSGNIWAAEPDGAGFRALVLARQTGLRISTFAQGSDGEIWVADYATGRVQALVPTTEGEQAPVTAPLSQTGCFDVRDPSHVPTGAVAYDVGSPLWSDGARKDRWVFVPSGTKIGVGADGDFDLPRGSVAVKTFSFGSRRVETRLLARYEDGSWAGYSYEWNDAQTDATLLSTGKIKDLGDGTRWTFPSREECFVCHTAAAGFSLGLEARQVELEPFAALFDHPIDRVTFPRMPAPDDATTNAESRARAYLHANCAMCHRDGAGAGAATIDLRVDRSLVQTRACGTAPSAGDLQVPGASLIAPGDPSRSILSLRMRALDRNRMPTLATRAVDGAGVSVVEEWIRGLTVCP